MQVCMPFQGVGNHLEGNRFPPRNPPFVCVVPSFQIHMPPLPMTMVPVATGMRRPIRLH